ARAKNSVSFGIAPGQPPSMNPTPRSSSSRATANLSAMEYEIPSRWAPSRSVVSYRWNRSPSGVPAGSVRLTVSPCDDERTNKKDPSRHARGLRVGYWPWQYYPTRLPIMITREVVTSVILPQTLSATAVSPLGEEPVIARTGASASGKNGPSGARRNRATRGRLVAARRRRSGVVGAVGAPPRGRLGRAVDVSDRTSGGLLRPPGRAHPVPDHSGSVSRLARLPARRTWLRRAEPDVVANGRHRARRRPPRPASTVGGGGRAADTGVVRHLPRRTRW